nr:hypothetical protein [Tanacetum cinerariifolium]
MVAPAISVSTNSPEESFKETIKIGVDVIHPVPVTSVVFPASTVVMRLVEHGEAMQGIHEHLLKMTTQRWEDIEEELMALRERERADMTETEGITLRARVRSLEVVETWLYGIVRDEREARARIERHLVLVQEELESLKRSSSSSLIFFSYFRVYDCGNDNSIKWYKSQGSENRPPMLNKENYVPWSSRLLRYAKSRPNGKLIHNFIINGPYVRRMIPEPADDQAIQTILLGLPEDIYAAVDSCQTAQEIWFTSNDGESIESYYNRFLKLMNDLKRNKHFLEKIATDYTQLYDFLKYNQKEVDELKAKRLAKTQDPLALMANSNNPYAFPAPRQDQPSFNQNYMQQPMPNPEDIIDLTTAMNMALALMAKAFKLNYSTPTNNNQRISSNPCNRQIAQPGINMGQDRQMQMVGGNDENQFKQYVRQNIGNLNGYNVVQNVGNQVVQNAIQNPRVQNVKNQNGLIGVPGNANQNGNGNLVTTCAEGNAIGHNGNQIRCYNCKGVGHFARNCTVKPKRMDVAYLQTQLLIAQKKEVRIQLQAEEFDLMAAAADLYEIEEVNANCILMANLQQASASDTQTDKAPVYDSEEQYTELLKPIPESHQVPHNDNNVISDVTSVEQSEGTVEQHPVNIEETRVLYDSLYHNLAIEVEKVNTVNRKKKKLKSDFKIREDELLDKQIQLEKKIKELDNILVKTGQSIQTIHMLSPKPDSFYHTEHKMALGYQNSFYLKQAQKKQQSLYDGKVLLEKHDPPMVHDSEETLQLAQESRQKMKQLNKEIKPANYTKINHLAGVFVSQTAKSREELYFLDISKMANVSKPI